MLCGRACVSQTTYSGPRQAACSRAGTTPKSRASASAIGRRNDEVLKGAASECERAHMRTGSIGRCERDHAEDTEELGKRFGCQCPHGGSINGFCEKKAYGCIVSQGHDG